MPEKLPDKKNAKAYLKRVPYSDDWVADITPARVFDGYTKCKGKYLFVWINKTAGMSVVEALGINKDIYNHYTAMELRDILGAASFDKLFKFCFVRNPWDKVVSEFRFRIWTHQNELTSDASFAEWVRSTYVENNPQYYDWPKMFLPQLEWMTDEKGDLAIDFIGRFENLQNDFNIICDTINIERKILRHENK